MLQEADRSQRDMFVPERGGIRVLLSSASAASFTAFMFEGYHLYHTNEDTHAGFTVGCFKYGFAAARRCHLEELLHKVVQTRHGCCI